MEEVNLTRFSGAIASRTKRCIPITWDAARELCPALALRRMVCVSAVWPYEVHYVEVLLHS